MAVIYIHSSDNTARFALGSPAAKTLVVFGVNPSTATDTKFDRTIHRVENYSRTHGFDGWLMLNLYPQRTTNPKNLHETCDPKLHAENIAVISKALGDAGKYTLCAAWGGLVEDRKYLAACLMEIAAALGEKSWHSIGLPTKRGHPRHPLYVRGSTPLEIFEMETYLKALSAPR